MTASACGKCGAPRTPESSPGGLCPACLLSAAFADSETLELSEEEIVDGLASDTTFGPFLIRRLLGRGGMAAVYEALETRLDRAVALKVLPSEFLHDQTFARRFETEARLIARLEHPNIVPIYASGIEAGIPWMSMRLLTGNLSSLLERRSLAPVETVQLLRHIATALDYAHGAGVVHRDIKPANILLDGSGTACVADFGLAQLMDSGNRLTRTGILTGTPHYMAPEQALGKRVDHRCDIYSLGIVAYEMLAGTTPFRAESPVAVLLQHVHEPLPAPADRLVPARWMDAIHKAAAKNPEDRWACATAFVDALELSVGAAAAGANDRDGQPGLFVQWRRRAVAGAAVVVVAVVVWVAIQRPRSVPDASPSNAAIPPKEQVALPANPAPTTVPNSVGESTGVQRTTPSRASGATSRGARATPPPISPPPPQPSPDSAAAGSPDTSAPPSKPVVLEFPLVTEPLTRVPGVAAAPPRLDDVFIAPEILRSVLPVYPPAAVAAGLEGEVVLAGVVGIDGKVSKVTVERSAHPLLDEAARRAWLQYQYKPARRNGISEPARVTFKFAFKLD